MQLNFLRYYKQLYSLISIGKVDRFFHEFLKKVDYLFREFCLNPDQKESNILWKDYLRTFKTWKFKNVFNKFSLSVEGIMVERKSTEGKNPSIKCDEHLNLERYLNSSLKYLHFINIIFRSYFECIVEKVGRWVSIGCASVSFKVDNYFVCGSSFEDPNCGFYSGSQSQGAYIKFMGKKKKKISRLKDGDIVGIWLNIHKNSLAFFVNNKRVASINISSIINEKLYPTISLGYETRCKIGSHFEPPSQLKKKSLIKSLRHFLHLKSEDEGEGISPTVSPQN